MVRIRLRFLLTTQCLLALWGPGDTFLCTCYQNFPEPVLCFYLAVPVYCVIDHISLLASATQKCQGKRVAYSQPRLWFVFGSDPSPDCICMLIFPLLHLKLHHLYYLTFVYTYVGFLQILFGSRYTQAMSKNGDTRLLALVPVTFWLLLLFLSSL